MEYSIVKKTIEGEEYTFKESIILVDVSILNRTDIPLTIMIKKGRSIKNPDEAIVYTSLYGEEGESPTLPEELSIGKKITIYAYDTNKRLRVLNLTIVGHAVGLASFSAPGEYTLLVSLSMIKELTNGSYSWIAIYSKSTRDEDIEALVDKAVDALNQSRYLIVWVWTNKPEENPINIIINSISEMFTTPLLLSIVLVAVVVISAGVALV